MRRRAFNQGGSILRWFAPKRSYTQGPLVAQEATPESKADLENPQQLAQDGAVEYTAEGQQISLADDNGVSDTQKSSARRPLPLSPLMDPSYLAAKQKHRLPKAAPGKEPTPFQQQLAKNPYAQALTTPVRMCSLTRIQLPSFFLQDFELIAHPSTNEPWYLPRSLTSPHSSALTDETLSLDASQPIGCRRGPRSYVLSRASLIRAMRIPKSGFTYGEERFSSVQAKQFPAFRALNTRWRRDMDTFVLDLMRCRIVEGLKYLCGRGKGYLQGCSDWEYAKGCKQVGAFLWLGPKGRGKAVTVDETESPTCDQVGEMAAGEEERAASKGEGTAASQEEEIALAQEDDTAVAEGVETTHKNSSSEAPGEFATLDMDKEVKSKVPVYNLQLLLGDSYVKDLRRHIPPTFKIFKHEVVALKNKKTTIDLQMRLWKLQGYLAEHKQVDNE